MSCAGQYEIKISCGKIDAKLKNQTFFHEKIKLFTLEISVCPTF